MFLTTEQEGRKTHCKLKLDFSTRELQQEQIIKVRGREVKSIPAVQSRTKDKMGGASILPPTPRAPPTEKTKATNRTPPPPQAEFSLQKTNSSII